MHTHLKHEVHRDLEGGCPRYPERPSHVQVALRADMFSDPDRQWAVALLRRRFHLVGLNRGTFCSLKSHWSIVEVFCTLDKRSYNIIALFKPYFTAYEQVYKFATCTNSELSLSLSLCAFVSQLDKI